ncbi:5-amino-6-(D-ribitylamino)uracil--L-tyrosine 4-hydroxyphenyl transferase CofH [Methanospirillum hungatei]|uniref:5-amino-6-(D-ribitylamino)uracil--L-tyrosine 4-hydroxyphenyl transferase CofH n=1 Tax=Methanospirillum hungatei TaxID=2203 RepID=UPI0026EC884D|nr:5-amino-6-(D-ribitylamino)uracil--L-tyrosine 4-hydroxyphenyl transferase CofH [Methanospirillum hungatei]MCA1916321.1 5-amino-6-(D-ribitylamino)uracil--L-tyrosine 4-hydroxyphenyl transferase CofH [Methanospirillum hungatei]
MTGNLQELKTLLDDVSEGHRLTVTEAESLFKVRDRSSFLITAAADALREKRCGNAVTWVKNQNINCSNVCVNSCGFCGYSCKPGDSNAFELTPEEVGEKAALAASRGVTEICTVSGLHPAYDLNSYLSIYRAIRENAPGVHIHASNPMEVAYAARKTGCSTREVLEAFRDASVGTLCGTAAEILVDEIRDVICPEKISTDDWVRIIKESHNLGIRSTATIMYGHCESVTDQVRHLSILRDIQDETHGFTEFVPLSFIHPGTPLYRKGMARPGATGREDMLMIAVSRLFLDNFTNIQVSWVKLGLKMVQIGLMSGANDIGGTLYEESISSSAGAKAGEYLDPADMLYISEDLGRTLVERRTDYSPVH